MTWLTAMEYLCHKWPRICSICRKHLPILCSFMTDHRVCSYIDAKGATKGALTAYLSGVLELTPGFLLSSCFFISFMCMFCRSLFVLLYSFLWPLCFLFFFNIRTLITPLVSSNSSSKHQRSNQNPYIEDEQKTELSNYMLPIFLQEMITSTPLQLRVAINLE